MSASQILFCKFVLSCVGWMSYCYKVVGRLKAKKNACCVHNDTDITDKEDFVSLILDTDGPFPLTLC